MGSAGLGGCSIDQGHLFYQEDTDNIWGDKDGFTCFSWWDLKEHQEDHLCLGGGGGRLPKLGTLGSLGLPDIS